MASPPASEHSNQCGRSRSQPRLQKSDCPLDNLILPPVGTSDHYLERCYCYLCACGQHVCPADLKRIAASPHVPTGPSQYMREFQRRETQPVHPLQLPRPPAIAGGGKMDLKTTAQVDYQPPGALPVIRHTKSFPKGTVKLVTRSSYQRDFPNWKPSEAILFKSNDLPYRGNFVGFHSTTTYQDDYEPTGKAPEQFYLAKSPKRADPISALSDFYGQTSHKSQFQKPPRVDEFEQTPLRDRKDFFSPVPVNITTTYRQEFIAKDQPRSIPFKRAAKRYASTDAFTRNRN